MPTEADVRAALELEGLRPLGAIACGDDESGIVFVTLAIVRDADNKQQPSNSSLRSASARLKARGLNVEFLLRYEHAEEIEPALRATLLHGHIDHIRNAFVSLSSDEARVWVEPKRALSIEELHQIKHRAKTFLALFDIRLTEVLLTSEELLPSRFAMLTAIRQLAPADISDLALALTRRSLPVPSIDWLVRRLDSMRKSGDIVRLANGKYVLTRYALYRLGTAKNKMSPDVARLLALARRGS
jgi:hypothetical protein